VADQTQAGQTQTSRGYVVWVTHCPDRRRLAHCLDHHRPLHPHHPARRHPTLLPASSSFLPSFFLLFFSSFLSSYNQVFPHIIRWGWFYFDSVFHAEVANYEWPTQKTPFVQVQYISYSHLSYECKYLTPNHTYNSCFHCSIGFFTVFKEEHVLQYFTTI
jgi:hypothetical protein